MKHYELETSCVFCGDGQAINNMMDVAIPVSLRTFAKYVKVSTINRQFGYDRYMLLRKDWHVSFYRSKWRGQRCYVFIHSAIEYIYTAHP